MKSLEQLLVIVENIEFTGNQKCIEELDNCLQDIITMATYKGYKMSGELLGLKCCSWVLHERYYMDTEEQLKWTFHHTKHRIIKSLNGLLKKDFIHAL